MEIVDNNERTSMRFEEAKQGEVMFYANRVLMKTESCSDDGFDGVNAVFLDNGQFAWVENYENVIRCKAKVIID